MAEEFEPPAVAATLEVEVEVEEATDAAPTDAEVDAAGRELEVVTFKMSGLAKGLRAKKTLGHHLRALGIVDIGRGQLVIAESNIVDTMNMINDEISSVVDSEVRVALIALKVKLNEQLINISQTHIKGTSSGNNGVVAPSKPLVSFPMGQPVQVNINQSISADPKK